MPISASCKLDRNAIKALTYLSLYKKADPKKRFVFWLVIFSVLAALSLFNLIRAGDTMFLILLCVSVFILLIQIYLYMVLPRIKYRGLKNMAETENQYIFYESSLKTISRSVYLSGEAVIQYSALSGVYETAEYLFLFQSDNQAFIVDKSSISDGSIEELRQRLCTYFKGSYCICDY